MKLSIAYWTKKDLTCPTCKSDKLVLIFFKSDKVTDILQAADKGKLELVSSSNPNRDLHWLCKACYDIGEVLAE